jgi:FAD-dependent urate hydroxylase
MTGALRAVLCHDGGHEQSVERTSRDIDRQVLVVGDDFAGVMAAGFLNHAGLDPVLAPSASEPAAPPVAVIWQPGLTLLERLGLRRPVVDRGRKLATLHCPAARQSWRADRDGRPALVAIDRSTLRELLASHVVARVRTAAGAVTAVESTTTGIEATFESGVTEPFDAAVTADRSCLGTDGPRLGDSLHTWAFAWPDERAQPDGPTEAWAASDAAFTVPTTDSTYVHLVTAAEMPSRAVVSPEGIANRFGHLFPNTDPLDGLDCDGFAYRRVPTVVPFSLARGHIARIGTAARVALPGGHLGPAIDIEAAWILADALMYGPTTVGDALAEYERRYRQRAARLWTDRPEPDAAEPETALSPLLRQLWRARRLVFSHICDGPQPPLARDVPESL